MKLSDLIEKDRNIMQGKPLKEKLLHLWTYYKWYFGAFLLVVIYIVSLIISNLAPGNILNGIFLNTTGSLYAASQVGEDFLNATNRTGQQVYFDSMYTSSHPDAEDAASVYESFQLLIAKTHTGELDFLVTGSDTVNSLMYNEFFVDLRQVLSPEQAERYAPYYLYMDMAFLKTLQDAGTASDLMSYPDPARPELMQEPVPVLIDLQTSPKVKEALYPKTTGICAFGFVVNGQHWDLSAAFLDYLMDH